MRLDGCRGTGVDSLKALVTPLTPLCPPPSARLSEAPSGSWQAGLGTSRDGYHEAAVGF